MAIRHLSAAMRAAEIMRTGRAEQTTIAHVSHIRRRKRTVQEIRATAMQASINRERDLA